MAQLSSAPRNGLCMRNCCSIFPMKAAQEQWGPIGGRQLASEQPPKAAPNGPPLARFVLGRAEVGRPCLRNRRPSNLARICRPALLCSLSLALWLHSPTSPCLRRHIIGSFARGRGHSASLRWPLRRVSRAAHWAQSRARAARSQSLGSAAAAGPRVFVLPLRLQTVARRLHSAGQSPADGDPFRAGAHGRRRGRKWALEEASLCTRASLQP